MATKRKTAEETVLGGDHAYWEMVAEHKPFDIRRCSNCEAEAQKEGSHARTYTFPKDMRECTLKECPDCHKPMKW